MDNSNGQRSYTHEPTFLEAFSITLHLTPSNLVSYSLAPPRIDNTNDGGLTTLLLLDHEAVVVPIKARERRHVLMLLLRSMYEIC